MKEIGYEDIAEREIAFAKAFFKMGKKFTTDRFMSELKGMGVIFFRKTRAQLDEVPLWLHNRCTKTSARRWIKDKQEKMLTILAAPEDGRPIYAQADREIVAAIALLKKHGYKVMKPISEWKEV